MDKPLFNAPIPIQQASGSSPVATAIGNLGSSVKKVGRITAQLQQEKERQILADAELKMKQSTFDLQDRLSKEYDPSKHGEIAREHFDNLQAQILGNEQLTPGFQNDLGDRLKIFTESKLMSIESDAKLQQVDNGRKLQVARIEMYQKEGDFDGAKALLDEGVGVYWGKEHAEAGKMKLKTAEKTAELSLMVNEEPHEAIKALSAKDEEGNYTYGGISPDQRRIALNKSRTAINQYRKAEIDDWETKIDNGLANPQAIEDFESDYMTKADKQKLIRSMTQNRMPATDEIEKGMNLIEDYIDFSKSAASDAEKHKVFMDLDLRLKSMYPSGTQNHLRERLDLHNPTKQASTQRARVNDKAQTRVSHSLKSGMLGDPESLDAKERARKAREAIYDLSRENPDFTEADVDKVLNGFIGVRNDRESLSFTPNPKLKADPNNRTSKVRNTRNRFDRLGEQYGNASRR